MEIEPQSEARSAFSAIESRAPGHLAVVGALVLGGGKYVAAVFKFKGVGSIITMLISILAYWWTSNLGLPGAVLFVALLLAHEMGHYWTARKLGIETSLPMFIPFLGAIINVRSKPEDAEKEAWMALAGPLLGALAAFACLPVYFWTGDKLWLWGASIGFVVNLFNLLPVSPLDGGRIIGAVWRGFWLVGLAVLLWLALRSKDVFLLLIFLAALSEINENWYEFKPEFWLVGALGTVAIAVWWGSFLVLILTFLLCLSYLTCKRARQNAQSGRAYKEWLLEQAEGYLEGRVDFESSSEYRGPKEEFRKKVEIARERLLEDLYPEENEVDLYYQVSSAKRFLIGSVYLGLSGLLAVSLFWVNSLNVFH